MMYCVHAVHTEIAMHAVPCQRSWWLIAGSDKPLFLLNLGMRAQKRARTLLLITKQRCCLGAKTRQKRASFTSPK